MYLHGEHIIWSIYTTITPLLYNKMLLICMRHLRAGVIFTVLDMYAWACQITTAHDVYGMLLPR